MCYPLSTPPFCPVVWSVQQLLLQLPYQRVLNPILHATVENVSKKTFDVIAIRNVRTNLMKRTVQTVWACSVTLGCVYGAGSPSVMVWWTVPISVMKSIVPQIPRCSVTMGCGSPQISGVMGLTTAMTTVMRGIAAVWPVWRRCVVTGSVSAQTGSVTDSVTAVRMRSAVTSVAVTSMCVETTAVSVRPWCVMGSKTVPGGRRKSSVLPLWITWPPQAGYLWGASGEATLSILYVAQTGTPIIVTLCAGVWDMGNLRGPWPPECWTPFSIWSWLTTRQTHRQSSHISRPECGRRSPGLLVPFISGGDLVTRGRWPWVVSLSYLGKPICSGVLISPRWVLTAGHCMAVTGVYNYTHTPNYIQVLLGSIKRSRDLDRESVLLRAVKILHHPDMKWTGEGTIYWDIALIQLERPVSFTSVIQPICLSSSQNLPVTSTCFLAGWGNIEPNHDTTVEYLREVKLRVWGEKACRNNTLPSEASVNTNFTLCAGYTAGMMSGCRGDSGSGLMCVNHLGQWSVEGIMSSGGAQCGVPSPRALRFTSVNATLPWIRQTMFTYGWCSVLISTTFLTLVCCAFAAS